MTQLRMTYDGLAQAIANQVNENILGEEYSTEEINQMVMDLASSECPDYLDHYDVADKAIELI
jgi:hypothetical protein